MRSSGLATIAAINATTANTGVTSAALTSTITRQSHCEHTTITIAVGTPDMHDITYRTADRILYGTILESYAHGHIGRLRTAMLMTRKAIMLTFIRMGR